ncbi:alpha/beta-hydrolase [Neoconidiobolus thromboides FSU 785]|nr:alpha/beta-hydrolase [Neoconidiobolus thromboides FSU 785]
MVFEPPKQIRNNSNQYNVQTKQYSSESELCVYHIHPSKTGNNPAPLIVFIESAIFLLPEAAIGFDQAAEKLSQSGIHVVRLQYRLTTKENNLQFPNHLLDCMKGYIDIITKSDLNYSSIHLAGHSVGGLMSLLIGFSSTKYLKYLNTNYNTSDLLSLFKKINGIISIAGVFDLAAIAKYNAFFNNNVATMAFQVEGCRISKVVIHSPESEDISRVFVPPPIKSEEISRESTNTMKPDQVESESESITRMGICHPRMGICSTLKEYSATSISLKDINEMNYSNLPKVLLIGSKEDTAAPVEQLLQYNQHLSSLNVKDVTLFCDNFGNHNQLFLNSSVIQKMANFIHSSNYKNLYMAKL